MNRRAFFGSLAALTAGMALDPERALWVPGRRTFFDLSAGRARDLAEFLVLGVHTYGCDVIGAPRRLIPDFAHVASVDGDTGLPTTPGRIVWDGLPIGLEPGDIITIDGVYR